MLCLRSSLVLCFVLAACLAAATATRLKSVNPLIGTGGAGWGIGQLPPGPQVPFGAMRLGPDTSDGTEPFRLPFEAFGGYYHPSTYIECFSHTHTVGAGASDFQNFGVTMTRTFNSTTFLDANYRSTYSHDTETVEVGYYSVDLDSHDVRAELTVAGPFSGLHRYTCRGGAPCHLVLDVCHTAFRKEFRMGAACKQAVIQSYTIAENKLYARVAVLNNGDLSGKGPLGGVWVYLYVEAEAMDSATGKAVPFSDLRAWENHTFAPRGAKTHNTTSGSLGISATLPGASQGVQVVVRSGLSFVGTDNAKLNLRTEQATFGPGGWITFNAAKTQTQQEWDAILQRVNVSGGWARSAAQMEVFYSAVYRSHLAPTRYNEHGTQEYMGMDNNVHRWPLNGYASNDPCAPKIVSDLSLWDIYRTEVPWFTLAAPNMARDIANSLTTMYEQSPGKVLPRWPIANVESGCMVGRHGVVCMVDSLRFGVGEINASAVLAATQAAVDAQNGDMEKFGYVPSDLNQFGASLTLDYSIDAYSAYAVSKMMNDTAAAAKYLALSKNFKNIFHNGYLCPKLSNGTFACRWDPHMPYPISKGYTEGNAEEYRWYVPHAAAELVALFPSRAEYATQLNIFFNKSMGWQAGTTLANPWYWPGNEPDILAPMQFNFAGNEYAHLTQYWMQILLKRYYTTKPSGIPGNDDYGCMSAWVIFAFMGLYPVASTEQYAVITPLFDNFTLTPQCVATHPHLSPLAGLTIKAYNRPAGAPDTVAYVAKVTLNGQPLTTPFVDMAQLTRQRHAVLEYTLSDQPQVFGGHTAQRPWMPPPTQ